jgi:hypothetical protein
MEKKRLEEFCRLGEKADSLLREGRARDALKTYSKIIANVEERGDVDSYLMAKVTLGVLRCLVKLGDFKNAYEVWNATVDESLHGVGIYALENAQTTVKDMMTYDMICAFLHSLGDSDKHETAKAINQYLSRVCEQAYEEGERKTMALAISNWKQHLREVFQGALPIEFAKPLIKFEKLFAEPVRPQAIDFPFPTPWEKPDDFREMSRVMSLRAEKSKSHKPGAA